MWTQVDTQKGDDMKTAVFKPRREAWMGSSPVALSRRQLELW